jgi:hypothetical protein
LSHNTDFISFQSFKSKLLANLPMVFWISNSADTQRSSSSPALRALPGSAVMGHPADAGL